MLQSADKAQEYLNTHHGVLGEGWTEVETFDDLDDGDGYETEEEEEFITLDLGAAVDPKLLQTELTYQLIGLDTALPFLKTGNTLLQGDVTPLIGDEVILGLIRSQENPQNPSHPPLYTTNKRITFRPITIRPRSPPPTHADPAAPARQGSKATAGVDARPGTGTERDESPVKERSMFLKQAARHGPNAGLIRINEDEPEAEGSRKRRGANKKKAQAESNTDNPAGVASEVIEPEVEQDQIMAEGLEGLPLKEVDQLDDPSHPLSPVQQPPLEHQGQAAPDVIAGDPNIPVLLSTLLPSSAPPQVPTAQATPPAASTSIHAGPSHIHEPPVNTKRPRRKRPEVIIRTAEELQAIDVEALADNAKIFVYPSAITTSVAPEGEGKGAGSMDLDSDIPLVYTTSQLVKLIKGEPTRTRGRPKAKKADDEGDQPVAEARTTTVGGFILATGRAGPKAPRQPRKSTENQLALTIDATLAEPTPAPGVPGATTNTGGSTGDAMQVDEANEQEARG